MANIELIRLHFDEATKFRAGDFSDPGSIHDSAMPGLATPKERFADISVELVETDVGATITYSSDDPVLSTSSTTRSRPSRPITVTTPRTPDSQTPTGRRQRRPPGEHVSAPPQQSNDFRVIGRA